MKEYLLEGNIQGQYRALQIYPMFDLPNHYLIHWDGFQVGIIRKNDGIWETDVASLYDSVVDIGTLIDAYEKKL